MYGKHFSSMYTGSMYGAGSDVFAVWGYVISHTVDSAVELNPNPIAAALGIKPEAVESAISYLCAPDPSSRNPVEGGRRLIKEGTFQYRVVTHAEHNAVRNEDERREYNRLKKREERARRASMSTTVNDVNDMSAMSKMSANTDTDTDTDTSVVDVVDDDGGDAPSVYTSPKSKAPAGVAEPTHSAAQAEGAMLVKVFGEPEAEPDDAYTPSARMQALADAFSQHLKVTQSLDFNMYVARRATVVDAAPEKEVLDVVEYVLVRDTKGYWKSQMLDEDEGRGGLKVFVRGYGKIREIAKSRGKAGRVSAKPAAQTKQTKLKAASVAPKPEDLILQGDAL